MTAKELLNTKSGKIGFFIFSILIFAWSIHGFVDLTRQTHTREVAREFVAASDELKKRALGAESSEVFLRRLKAIDPGYAPAEVKEALHDYIFALEQGLDAAKAGRDATKFDAAMDQARQRLIASVQKWD